MDESSAKMMTFYCPVEYTPEREYIRQEIIDAIMPHQELLCFFAQASGYSQCVLGLDFDGYDTSDGTVPVIVMSGEEARPLLGVHGRRFRRAYHASRPRNSLVVTFVCSDGRGWFEMGWRLNPAHTFAA